MAVRNAAGILAVRDRLDEVIKEALGNWQLAIGPRREPRGFG
jgi:hypothetical protein